MGKGFNQSSLVIFVRNPQLGKVKSRLAKSLGEPQALAIYLKLLQHTRKETEQLRYSKTVYYSDFIDTEDEWNQDLFGKALQSGKDLGERMWTAFEEQFSLGFTSVCIIGSDTPEITTRIIEDAFQVLESHDAVIGPADDGGYYLIGLKKNFRDLFINRQWSTEKVFEDTIEILRVHRLKYHLLPVLSDIDNETDLKKIYHKMEWKES